MYPTYAFFRVELVSYGTHTVLVSGLSYTENLQFPNNGTVCVCRAHAPDVGQADTTALAMHR